MLELAVAEAYRPPPSEYISLRAALEERSQSIRRASMMISLHSSTVAIKSFFRRASQGELEGKSSKVSAAPASCLVNFRIGQEKLMRAESPYSRPSPDESLADTDEFDSTVNKAVDELGNDFTSGARQLADASLQYLVSLIDITADIATSWGEFWARIVYASRLLSTARPSMSAAITSCLLRALERIARQWNEERKKGISSTTKLAQITKLTLATVLTERKQALPKLGHNFTQWLQKHHSKTLQANATTEEPPSIHILTLSNSSTIRAALLHTLATFPHLTLHLTIMESRPRCEGADMAAQLDTQAPSPNFSLRLIPDCAVATAIRETDIVLLGADCISSTGDVSNKIGSLSAAACARQLNPSAAIVVLADVDKIAALGLLEAQPECHPACELGAAWGPDARAGLEGKGRVTVYGEWFEWVPGGMVDAYITELGEFEREKVRGFARDVGELREYIFG